MHSFEMVAERRKMVMKATRSITIAMAALVVAIALSFVPTLAFADTQEADASADSAVDVGESDPSSYPDSGNGGAGDGAVGSVSTAVAENGTIADSTWEDGGLAVAGSEPQTDIGTEESGGGQLSSTGEAGACVQEGDGSDAGAVADSCDAEGLIADEGDAPGINAGGDIDESQESFSGDPVEGGTSNENQVEAEAGIASGTTGTSLDAGVERLTDDGDAEAALILGSDAEGAEAVPSSEADNGIDVEPKSKAKAGSDSAAAALVALDEGESEAANGELIVAQGASESGLTLGVLEIAIAKNLIEGALYGSASGTFSWTASHLLTSLFGGVVGEDTQQKLSEILEKLDEIETSITTLKTNVERIQMQNIMNELKYLFGDPTVYTAYKALQDVEDDLAAKKITPEQAKAARLKALTATINISEDQWGTINTDFDQYVNRMWDAMTGPWDVTVEDQRQQSTLMQVHYELLRRSYKWEHQSYDEWSFFQGRCVSLLMATLTMERASLQARIDLLLANGRESEAYGVGERLDLINDWIKQAAGYKVVLPDGVQVVYPGFFSDETWAAQYWMFKERDDSERYYWVPSHEIVFYAEVNTQHVPQENKNGGLDYPNTLDGLSWNSSNLPYPKFNFWKPFVRYQGGDTLLASASQLKAIFKDYGSSKHLYTIFMSEEEGNFQGLDIDGNEYWWFVVDPDSDHALEYVPHFFKADRLRCYVLASSDASTDTAILCYYHNQYTEPDHYTHYIGVGVKRVGPEVYDPDGNKSAERVIPDFYTAVRFPDDWAQWWPLLGDFAMDYEDETHGGVDRVLVDGKLLDPAWYEVRDGKIVVREQYLASLGFGEHEFFMDTKGGGHTVVFSLQPDGVYYVASGTGASWAPGSGDGLTFVIKRTENDALTFSRLVDVLVDGASVPAWGYTAHAGSAIVTLTAAFLDTLAPGLHTLTAVFADGNAPQVAFTVNASGGTVPARVTGAGALVSGAGAVAQPGQTPPTGDGLAAPMVLLALVACACAAVALRARRRV